MTIVSRFLAALILCTAGLMATLAAGMVLVALYVIAGTALAAGWAIVSTYCAWQLVCACLQVD